jgi:hypothetical protein
MIRAYLLSFVLQQYFIRRAEFAARYPHAWLVWEPGHWTSPPYDESTVVPKPSREQPLDVSAEMKRGSALCFELKPLAPPRPIRVGRAPGNDLVINDGTVSREHLALSPAAITGHWVASLLPQAKSTRVRGAPFLAGEVALQDGDALGLGELQLTYYDPAGFVRRLEVEVRRQLGQTSAS